MTATPSRPLALATACLLLTVGLAGCLGGDDDVSAMTFDEARSQAHTTAEPVDASTLRLGLIEPTPADNAPQGKTNVTVVLWDAGTDAPVEDAEMTVDAWMPAMGHGTSPEEDPEPVANGVYRGSTNLMMGGEWVLKINVTRTSGVTGQFQVPVTVAGGGGMDHGMDHDAGPSTTYDSYEDAKEADGEVLEPSEASSYRLKLLEPSREDLDTGQQNVTVLAYDSQADEPVKAGNATLNATMPAMGHGTSPEEDPVHAEHGVWTGLSTFSMNGTWVLELALQPENGSWLHWDVNVTVGDGSMDMDEEEPAFEPYTEVFEDNVTSADYAESYDLTVKGANATVTTNATLQDASLLDNLTVSLVDPEGSELGSISLDADTTEGQLVVPEAPTEGEYGIDVQGQAVGASYTIEVHVTPP